MPLSNGKQALQSGWCGLFVCLFFFRKYQLDSDIPDRDHFPPFEQLGLASNFPVCNASFLTLVRSFNTTDWAPIASDDMF